MTRPFLICLLALCAAAAIAAVPLKALAQTDDDEFTQTSRPDPQDDPAARAVELFNQAQKFHGEGDLDKALDLYGQAIELLPEFPEAEYQRATIFQSRGKFDDAEAALKRAISYKEDWTLPMAALGGLLVTEGRTTEARSILEKAVSLDPMCIPCYPALTDIYVESRAGETETRKLLQKLSYLTTKAKIPANVWAAKSALERTLGDAKAARVSLDRANAIDPNDISTIAESVDLLLAEGDSKGALAQANKLVAMRPDSVPAKIKLAKAMQATGDVGGAIDVLEKIPNGGANVAAQIGALKAAQGGDPAELEKRLAESPDDPAILGSLCSMLRTSDPEKALDYCLKASKLEPANIDHAIGYGAALLQLRRYAQAADLLGRLSAASPENYTIRANFATALFQLGAFEEAKNQYLWITEKQPDLAAGYYFLAICYDRLEFYVDAMANYQRFLSLADPAQFKDEIDRVQLGFRAFRDSSRTGKARELESLLNKILKSIRDFI